MTRLDPITNVNNINTIIRQYSKPESELKNLRMIRASTISTLHVTKVIETKCSASKKT